MSEILDEYYRIAIEKGLIKKEAQQTREEKWADKEYREKIQALYGLNINNTDKSIIEEAHPDMIIIAPAHDKVNGLVENELQRHDIMVGLVNKSPVPNTPTRKIAEQDLLDTLVSLGFALDSEEQYDLRDKADECSIELVKKVESKSDKTQIKKEAVAPVAAAGLLGLSWPWVLGIVGAVTAVGVLKNQLIGFISQGAIADTDRLISELNDITNTVGPQNKPIIKEWVDALNWFKSESNKIKTVLVRKQSIQVRDTSSFDQVGLEKEGEYSKADFEQIKKYTKLVETVSANLPRLRAALNSMSEEKDTSESEWWSAIKGAWHSFVGSDLDDAKNATDALIKSLKSYIATLPGLVQKAQESAKETQSTIQSQLEQQSQESRTVPVAHKQQAADVSSDPDLTEEVI
jgi:hypothetical protein